MTPLKAIVGAVVAATIAGAIVGGARGRRGRGPIFGAGGSQVGVGGAARVIAMGRGERLTCLGVGVVLEAELLED